MAKKGDSKEPDARERLVGCEVNKGGEKVDAFDASTPPLEAKNITFSQFSSERDRKGRPLRISFVDIRKNDFASSEGVGPCFLPCGQIGYGCRDAGHIWELCYRSVLESIGFVTGAASLVLLP